MPTYILRDGSSTQERRLDRIAVFDETSRQFPVRRALAPGALLPSPVSKTWTIPGGKKTEVLDQEAQGACVGAGVTNDLRFNPVPVKGLTMTFAREKIYWGAQRIDGWEGGSYPGASPRYEGTAVLYGVKVAAALGYYGQYSWAFSEPEMCLGVGYLGPAIIGIDWYDGMFRPDGRGFIRPTGPKMGGHCVLIIGVNVRSSYYYVYNSWGPTWGNHGVAKISRGDMSALLATDGECCIATERLSGPTHLN